MLPNSWVETDLQTNAAATATHAADALNRHTLNYIIASYDTSSVSGLLTVTIGSTTFYYHIHGADVIPVELFGAKNEAISASLAAGGSGIDGSVTILGVTD